MKSMNALLTIFLLSLAAGTTATELEVSPPQLSSVAAQQDERRLGEHPAVIIKRLHAQQGYDYLSKFYPHPAWLYLYSEAPRAMMDHPAVIVFKRHQRETQACLATPQQNHIAAGER